MFGLMLSHHSLYSARAHVATDKGVVALVRVVCMSG